MASGGDYSLAAQAWRRFKRHKLAMLGAWVLFAIAVAVVVAPMLVPFTFDAIDLRNRFCRPSWPHVFGTDELGHDVFVRLMYGGRISLLVGVTGPTSATLAGVLIGSVAGFWGGRVDRSADALHRYHDDYPGAAANALCRTSFQRRLRQHRHHTQRV